jgi:hypothetical protein
MRRHASGVGCGRLRAGLVTPLPGGLGPPSAPTTRGRLNWLDAARTKAGESLPDRGPSRAPSAPGSYGPGDRNRRQISPDCASLSGWSAERRPHLPKRRCGTKDTGSASRRSTPSIFRGARKGPRSRGGKTAYPAPVKNTGAGAWLFDILIGEMGRASEAFLACRHRA